MNPTIILSLAGGLGLFLYGMRIMSDSIEKVAGAKLRGILEKLTTNRFSGHPRGYLFYGCDPVFLGVYRDGSQFR